MEVRKIRKTYKNIKLLKEMDDFCFPEDDSLVMGLRKYHWWIVYENDIPVAYAGACVYLSSLTMVRAGVLPKYRGRGLQGAMIETRISYAQANKLEEVVTYTSKCNTASIKNLKRCNFIEYKAVDDFLCWKRSAHIPNGF